MGEELTRGRGDTGTRSCEGEMGRMGDGAKQQMW
jgi:hypothetical protein